MTHNNPEQLAKAKVNLETASMPWTALQRFFATGHLLSVEAELDLIEVAYQMSIDNKQQIEHWLNTQKIQAVTDQQARNWQATNAQLWTTVVKPWVLVQALSEN